MEVKKSDQDRDYVSGLGQLLGYKTMLSAQFCISPKKIKLALLVDRDSVITLATIKSNNLHIDMYVFGKEKVKCYG